MKQRPGGFAAIQILHCGHVIETGQPMFLFRVGKGQMTVCPQGCGEQKTKQVKSGECWS